MNLTYACHIPGSKRALVPPSLKDTIRENGILYKGEKGIGILTPNLVSRSLSLANKCLLPYILSNGYRLRHSNHLYLDALMGSVFIDNDFQNPIPHISLPCRLNSDLAQQHGTNFEVFIYSPQLTTRPHYNLYKTLMGSVLADFYPRYELRDLCRETKSITTLQLKRNSPDV